MPCVTWNVGSSNLEKGTEEYEWLEEINKHYGCEIVVIQKYTYTKRKFLFKKEKVDVYYIYINLDNFEYQRLMCFETLDLQDIKCYLLGYLHGLGK